MELDTVLENRRSIRQYKEGQMISKEIVEQLIDAAILAPSWKNSQTGRYYVVSSKEMLEKVKMESLPEFNRESSKTLLYSSLQLLKRIVLVLLEKVKKKMNLEMVGVVTI